MIYGFHLKRKLTLAGNTWPVSKGIITRSELGSMSSNNGSPGYYTFEGPHDSGMQHNLVLVIDPKPADDVDLKSYVAISNS